MRLRSWIGGREKEQQYTTEGAVAHRRYCQYVDIDRIEGRKMSHPGKKII